MLPSNTIIFVHPPKTAGTNICFMAEALSKNSNSFKCIRFAVPRVPMRSPGFISEGWSGGLESAFNALRADPDYCKDKNFISA
jgi:hypothetical protein